MSVIVLASGAADVFRACLSALRADLGPSDEITCVLDGDRPELRAVASGESGLTVLDAPGGHSAWWHAGVQAAAHPVVVLLDGDVLLPEHWLDILAAAVQAPGVVAAGPACRQSFGPQGADVPVAALGSPEVFREHARAWAERHRGQITTVEHLGPICVAVSRAALAATGDHGTDLPFESLRSQGQIVVAREALLAHVDASPEESRCALRTRPAAPEGAFISAVLVIADEEAVLGECLTAVQDFADEIVVYDCGSVDRSREIARAFGATVVGGHRDDGFAGARNRALAHCTGEWVLAVEADEITTGNRMALRGRLLFVNSDAVLVPVRGSRQVAPSLSPRLFRSARCRFDGATNERLVDRISGTPVATHPAQDLLTLAYPDSPEPSGPGRHARNLRAAHRRAEDLTDAPRLIDQAHRELAAGNLQQAVALSTRVIQAGPPRKMRVLALKTTLNALIQLNQLDEANRSLVELRAVSSTPFAPDEWESRIRFAGGDYAAAVVAARRMPERAVDDTGATVGRGRLAEIEIKSLVCLGNHHEAAERLRERVRAGDFPMSLAEMAEALNADGSALAELASLAPAPDLPRLLAAAHLAPVELVDDLLEALWADPERRPTVLPALADVGETLPLHRALVWSSRIRESAPGVGCPLLAVAQSPRRTLRERALGAALVLEFFHDEAAEPLLREALEHVPDADSQALLEEVRSVAPRVGQSIDSSP